MDALTFVLASAFIVASPAVEAAQKKECALAYRESGWAFDDEKRWSYFRDTVNSLKTFRDGRALVTFKKSARAYTIPQGSDALLKAAEKSLRDGSAVHVAIDEGKLDPRPKGQGKRKWIVKWIDATEQHSSCR